MSEDIPQDKLEFAALVQSTVAGTTEIAQGLETILQQDKPIYTIPKPALESIQALLSVNAYLTQNLFEENAQILDKLEELKTKHNL